MGAACSASTAEPRSVAYARTPDVIRRGLAPLNEVRWFRARALAVARTARVRDLGGATAPSRRRRCLLAAEEVGGVALLIDAKNAAVGALVRRVRGGAAPRSATLIASLPLATLNAALVAAGKL